MLLVKGQGVPYSIRPESLRILEREEYRQAAADRIETAGQPLLIYENDRMGRMGLDCMSEIFREMAMEYDVLEARFLTADMLADYTKIVCAVTDLTELGETTLALIRWVRAGNSLLFLYAPANNGMFQMIQNELGVLQVGDENSEVSSLHFREEIMPGCMLRDFPLLDAFDSAMMVSLDRKCRVLLESADDRPVAILWERKVGEGKIVFDNLNILDRAYLGFHCAAYSLLGDGCVWPVINASTYYIDDFPAPVPEGDSRFITRDYHMSTEEFYTRHWWKDVSSLAERYGIRYTGLVIEEYSDQVQQPFSRNIVTDRFRYFGGSLLRAGGELGLHGYNHMPLVLRNFDFQNQYATYRQWESYEDMKAAVAELAGFCEGLFPEEEFQVYVPPSNVISQEGISLLTEEFPEIRAIASVYISEENGVEYGQDFGVDENGMVQTPRIISGYILEDFSRIAALSELTMHAVNTHFQHPDDVMDEDRGAALGWREMFSRLEDYTGWLYEAMPEIRSLTGSELAAAVQRYRALSVRQESREGELRVSLGGFVDEAWLYVRINEGRPGEVTGGTLTPAAEDLYLLCAESPEIIITLEKESTE